jgi:hypothetical protein
MQTTNEILNDLLPDGWDHDGFGFDSNLVCPHGETIEMDGVCSEGCESPLMGMI